MTQVQSTAESSVFKALRVLRRAFVPCVLGMSLVGLMGCGGGPKVVRGSDVKGLDDEAFGTGLDRRDLKQMLQKNMEALQTSALVQRWKGEDRPTVAVLSMRNETSEHIDSALQALITEVETTLVNGGHVRVVSQESQPELVAMVRNQQSDAFDPAQVAQIGRQVGARYFVTGRVNSVDERSSGERRVQYFLFMRVLDAETADILWQNSAEVTKAIVK
jgi:penicillin-binding protein activator